ncbi:MAG: hypothetical protein Q9163_004488 [Psora crenata]
MADLEAWSTNANDALDISLVQAGEHSPNDLSIFHPRFTYPIFGEEERIFGYQGLRIHLRFAAHNLRPHAEISYDKKFKAVGETKATDIVEALKPWTTDESFDKTSTFNDYIQNDTSAKDFQPPGELLESYRSRGRKFEIWSGDLSDPAIRLLIGRMQILISFFIEGGTPIELDDQAWTLGRWRVYLVYEKVTPTAPNASSYSLVGYSTSYRFITYSPSTLTNDASKSAPRSFTFPPSTPLHPSSLPSRIRISQFLILPSHHSHGHGSHLYNAMVKTFLASPTCTEITVEDPNEAFDDLRDYCDYARLSSNGTFSQITLNTSIDPRLSANKIGVRVPTSHLLDMPLLESLRHKNKIAPRQFYRLVEMYLLSRIAPYARQAGASRLTQRGRASNLDDRAFYYWRLLVKQRIYKQNKDVLIQLARAERTDKVEQTVGEVAGDYERLLREINGDEARHRRKRKNIVDDDEDEDMTTGDSKRARSEAL